MAGPISIYRPKLHLVPLDESGEPDEGELVDVSCDMRVVDLTLDTPQTSVTTFCGTFQTPGDIEEGATFGVVVTPETHGRWAPLVGTQVEARVYDRNDSVDYRRFVTQVPADPSLYGSTEPGSSREIDMDVPIMESVEWVIAS